MKKGILNIVICLVGLLLFVLVSTMAVTKYKPLFYYSINKFQLVENTSYSEDEMKENYSYIVDYLFDDNEEFNLPSIKYSQNGASHFNDVRKLYALGEDAIVYLTAAIIVLCFLYYRKYSNHNYLRHLSAVLITVPISLVLIISFDFNKYFIWFHKIFFRNDNWLFSPIEDPIINILPEGFFALCGGAIILLTALFGIAVLMLYLVNKKIVSNRYAQPVIN